MPPLHFSIVANRALGGREEGKKEEKKKTPQTRTIYAPSIYSRVPLSRALCTIQAIFRATWTIWRYMSCPALLTKKGDRWVEGWTLFIAFSSCLVLAHCFCHAHLHLPVVSYPLPPSLFSSSFLFLSSFFLFSPPLPPLSLLFSVSPVSFYEYRGVSFKSKDMGAVGQAGGAADTPLPHPEQLLNLRNRIISAKVAALFHSQEHCKQTERNRGEGKLKTGNRKLFVSLMLTSVIAEIDLVMNFPVSALIPTNPLLNPMSLIYFSRHAQRAVTISG